MTCSLAEFVGLGMLGRPVLKGLGFISQEMRPEQEQFQEQPAGGAIAGL